MTLLLGAVAVFYALGSLGLFAYALHSYAFLVAHLWTRRRGEAEEAAARRVGETALAARGELPFVTVQLPIYNERHVVERLIEAALALDYPRDRLEVQILDDSTDVTTEIVERVVATHAGRELRHLRRGDRVGYKAGALAHGLGTARGEIVAILDADFVPEPDFLRRVVPFFASEPDLAFVQGRWGHLNRTESLLTRAQAIGVDGHFGVEQAVRSRGGLFLNFNGTCGVWRRAAIDDAGGWSAATLTEDLDLSYRALLRGWRARFLPDVAVAGELPGTLAALRQQQFRWAKGSIQTARRLLGAVWRSERTLSTKLAATLHLTHYAVHPLMLATALLSLPFAFAAPQVLGPELGVALAALTLVGTGAPNSLYVYAERTLYPGSWLGRVAALPALVLLGIGLALGNTRAVLEALLVSEPGEFVRTPKTGATDRGRGRGHGYGTAVDSLAGLELAIGIYCGVAAVVGLAWARFWFAPLLLLYAAGFTTVGAVSLAARFRRERAASPTVPTPEPAFLEART